MLVSRLRLEAVRFVGHVDLETLLAYYKVADVFVCMSEHEGFCVPLLESMHFDVPIVAYVAGAVSQTLGDAGVLVKEKNYEYVAEMVHLLVSDKDFRRQVVQKQRERLKHFSRQTVEEKIIAFLNGLA